MEFTANLRSAATAIAGIVARDGAAPAARRVKAVAAAPVSMTTAEMLNARLYQLIRPRRPASSVLPPATRIASPGSRTSAAAKVAASSTVTLVFCVRCTGRSCAAVARQTSTIAMARRSAEGRSITVPSPSVAAPRRMTPAT